MKRLDIGERIERLRKGKYLTQSELDEAMTTAIGRKVSRETVKQWECGERDLKTEYTVAIADFFGVSCDYLLRRTNKMEGREVLTITIEVDAPAGMAQGVKEHLAMCLERFGDTRVVEIRESEPEQMKIV